jgi:transposase
MTKPLISNELWAQIEPLLPAPRPRRFQHPGRKRIEPRRVLTGILFVLKTGITWEDLPIEMGCGCGVTCLNVLKSWHRAGVWLSIQELLQAHLPEPERFDWRRTAVSATPRRRPKQDTDSAEHAILPGFATTCRDVG